MKELRKRYDILVVEDNTGDYILVEEYLDEYAIVNQLYWSQDYKQASKFLSEKQNKVDIILLDLTLPDKKGEDLINAFKKLTENIPIIILTGYGDTNFAIKSLSLGASDYLMKDSLNATILGKSIVYNIERNKVLVNLKDSEQRYADLFHLSPLPMWVFDLETLKFMDVNDAAIQHYGYSYVEFLSMTISDIRPKREVPKLLKSIGEVIDVKNSGVIQGEFIHQKKNGEIIQVEIRSNQINYHSKKANIILVNDVTERNNQMKAIRLQNERLRDIAWTQSHIVRAPLARLMGLVNILEQDITNTKEQTVFLGHLQKSANDLDKIIRDMVFKAQEIDLNKESAEDKPPKQTT